MRGLEEKIRALALGLHLKIEEFVGSLLTLEKQKKRQNTKLRQDWAGALKDYRQQYTSLELQQETVEYWTK